MGITTNNGQAIVTDVAMTEQEMMTELEKAREASEDGNTYWALSNGKKIGWTSWLDTKEFLLDNGYWVCSIFENGHRVEA